MKKIYFSALLCLLFTTAATAQIPELWGTMSLGGSFGIGGIVKIKGDGSGYVMDHACTGGSNGGSMNCTLMPQSPTALYGTSTSGGNQAKGDIFSYNPFTKNYAMLFSMDSLSGYYPRGPLAVTPGGKVYGLTNNGGIYDKGVLFEYDIVSDQYTKLHDFDNTTGQLPFGGVVLSGSTNKIYGMTTGGGLNSGGIIFSYDISASAFSVVHHFDFSTGFFGYGTLQHGGNGLLYGMTFGGGNLGYGVIFSFNPANNSYSVVHHFDGTNGSTPMGQLFEDGGTLYGCTSQGGTQNKGVIFSFSIAGNALTKLHDFDGTGGASPYGGVIRASDGKLYGMTLNGGVNNLGVIYSFNLSNNLFTKLYDGSFATGALPGADLIEFSGPTSLPETGNTGSPVSLFPNPSHGEITIRHENFSKAFVLQVMDAAGRKVIDLPLNAALSTVQLHLNPGLYFYQVPDGPRLCYGKLMIE